MGNKVSREVKESGDGNCKYTLLEDPSSFEDPACTANTDHQEGLDNDCDSRKEHVSDDSELTSACETFWNICNTIQGLPILAIPYAIRNGGYMALLALIIVSITSNYTAQTIVRCLYEDSPAPDSKRKRVRSSLAEIGKAWNARFGHHLVLVSEFAQLMFLAAVYPRMVGRMLAKSLPSTGISCWLWTLMGGLAFIPNVFIQNLSQVAWTSIITVISAKVIFVAVFTYSIMQYHSWEIASLDNFDIHTFPTALGILIASYLSQPFVPVIEGSMRKKEQFNMLMNVSYCSMTLLNVVIGVVAYIAFRPHTAEVITNSLPEGSFRQTVNIMASLLAFTSYTLPMFTIFDIAQNANIWCIKKEHLSWKESRAKVLALRLLLVSLSVILASMVPRFTYLLAFVGSTAGIGLEFIFPPMFHVKIYFSSLSWWEIAIDVIVISLGIFFLLSGTYYSGQSLFQKSCCHETASEDICG